MTSYRRALQFSIVLFFAASIAACSGGGGGGSAYQGGGADQTGLTVTITNPGAPEIDTTDDSMSLSGNARSPGGVTSVSWETDRGSEGSASGTDSWTASDIPLELGANTITVTATNAAGQTRSDTIVINRESGGTGSVTLSWIPPTERTDGTPLQTLAGYKISYGRMSEVYDYTINLDNPGLASYVVEDLVPGDWYFVMAAYDTEGLESDYSNEAKLRVD